VREANRKKAIQSPNQVPAFEPNDNIVFIYIFRNLLSDAKEIETHMLVQTENVSEMKKFKIIFRSFHIQALYDKYKSAAGMLRLSHKTMLLSVLLYFFSHGLKLDRFVRSFSERS